MIGLDLYRRRGLLRLGPSHPVGVGSKSREFGFRAPSSQLDVRGPANVGAHDASLALVEECAIKLTRGHLPRPGRTSTKRHLTIYRNKRGELRLGCHHLQTLGLRGRVVTGMVTDLIEHGPRQQVFGGDRGNLAIWRGDLPRDGGILPRQPIAFLCVAGEEQNFAVRYALDGEDEAGVIGELRKTTKSPTPASWNRCSAC